MRKPHASFGVYVSDLRLARRSDATASAPASYTEPAHWNPNRAYD
ncbi:MAG: hypothetical protein ACE10K_15185 [Rhodothermales bacterium]